MDMDIQTQNDQTQDQNNDFSFEGLIRKSFNKSKEIFASALSMSLFQIGMSLLFVISLIILAFICIMVWSLIPTVIFIAICAGFFIYSFFTVCFFPLLYQEKKPKFEEMLEYGKKHVFSFLILQSKLVLVNLSLFLILFSIIVLLSTFAIIFSKINAFLSVIFVVFIFLLSLASIFIIIAFTIIFCCIAILSNPFYFETNRKDLNSIAVLYEIVISRFWKIFGHISFAVIVGLIFSATIKSLEHLQTDLFKKEPVLILFLFIVFSVFLSLFSIFWQVFLYIFYSNLYLSLENRDKFFSTTLHSVFRVASYISLVIICFFTIITLMTSSYALSDKEETTKFINNTINGIKKDFENGFRNATGNQYKNENEDVKEKNYEDAPVKEKISVAPESEL